MINEDDSAVENPIAAKTWNDLATTAIAAARKPAPSSSSSSTDSSAIAAARRMSAAALHPRASGLTMPASIAEIEASEPSGDELDDVESHYYRAGSNTHNKIHVPRESKPSKTACKWDYDIATMDSVTLDEEQRDILKVKRFCLECAKLRPDRFPEHVIAAAFPKR